MGANLPLFAPGEGEFDIGTKVTTSTGDRDRGPQGQLWFAFGWRALLILPAARWAGITLI